MTSQVINQDKTVAAMVHLSTFSQFFFPFGNFIFPLIFWTAKKNDPFVSEHAKQALNFQISFFLYIIFLIALGVAGAVVIGLSMDFQGSFYLNENQQWIGNPFEATPVLLYIMFMVLLLLTLIVLNIYAVVSATVSAGEGKHYHYPLSINFLKALKRSDASEPSETTGEQE